MKFLSFLCTKWMENCEAMTSSPHSFAYSHRLVKKCFLKIRETSKCHNFLIFQPIFIRFSLLCLKIFTLSSEIKLNLLWSSSLMGDSLINEHVFWWQIYNLSYLIDCSDLTLYTIRIILPWKIDKKNTIFTLYFSQHIAALLVIWLCLTSDSLWIIYHKL